ncbi:Alg9-like mannosyltransferase family-domain-containing protein [Cladochytrium replicatum]|nr:Alg9-like mannosyltransferase family-domain-containing protein [Cladochytrium replicatum]
MPEAGEARRRTNASKPNTAAGKTNATTTNGMEKRQIPGQQPGSLSLLPYWTWDAVFAALVLSYMFVCPYTKVEESFNLQATHDLLVYTPFANHDQYDHISFPGVVPRTFIGPILIWIILSPIVYPIHFIFFSRESQLWGSQIFVLQYLVRGTLGLLVAASLARFRWAVRKRFGNLVATWCGILNCVQFHLPFWSTRTLPNVFAFVFVTWALGIWIETDVLVRDYNLSAKKSGGKETKRTGDTLKPRDEEKSYDLTPPAHAIVFLLVVSVSIFRSEISLLIFPLFTSELLIYRSILFPPAFSRAYTALVLSVALTVTIDSIFWRAPWFWPEMRVFIFNAIKGGAVAYGVSPLHAYFTSLLPRIAPLSYPLSIFALIANPSRLTRYLLPIFAFVALLSFQPHKEWRFIIHVLPMLNASAGVLISSFISAQQNKLRRLRVLLVALLLILVVSGSLFGLYVSSLNYPGGAALAALHNMNPAPPVRIHIDAYTAMTGASRFGESARELGWTYSKNESHSKPEDFVGMIDGERMYTHLLSHEGLKFHDANAWEIVGFVEGYSGIRVGKEGEGIGGWVKDVLARLLSRRIEWDPRNGAFVIPLPVWVRTETKVWILEHRSPIHVAG